MDSFESVISLPMNKTLARLLVLIFLLPACCFPAERFLIAKLGVSNALNDERYFDHVIGPGSVKTFSHILVCLDPRI
jgi:hypothetical protein